jgi:hypothetical protein
MISTKYHYEVAHKVITGKITQPCTYGADDAAGLYAAISDLLSQALHVAFLNGSLVKQYELVEKLLHATMEMDSACAAMTKPINY